MGLLNTAAARRVRQLGPRPPPAPLATCLPRAERSRTEPGRAERSRTREPLLNFGPSQVQAALRRDATSATE